MMATVTKIQSPWMTSYCCGGLWGAEGAVGAACSTYTYKNGQASIVCNLIRIHGDRAIAVAQAPKTG